MTKGQESDVHTDYIQIEELFANLDIWDHPSIDQEVVFREYMRDIIVSKVLDPESTFDVKYGRYVDKNSIEPKRFQATKKVEVKKENDDQLGKIYKISVCISDINVNPSDRVNLYFDGIISKENGIEPDKPITIRRG